MASLLRHVLLHERHNVAKCKDILPEPTIHLDIAPISEIIRHPILAICQHFPLRVHGISLELTFSPHSLPMNTVFFSLHDCCCFSNERRKNKKNEWKILPKKHKVFC